MVLKLYAGPNAGRGSAIVALLLAEKQIPFEHILVNLFEKEHKNPRISRDASVWPDSRHCSSDDDGFVLYESRAICRYLGEKYADQGTAFLPAGLKERALVEQAASVEFANFHPAIVKVVRDVFGKQGSGQPPDPAILAEFSAKLEVYEVILGKHKFLAGDEFTLADLFHFSYAPMLEYAAVDIMTSSGPNVKRWWNDLISRPAWVKLKAEGMKGTIS
ncbi:Glutathione S-transferase [Mycena venus]|uniref:glutathione transferase n=1 Tax=Mycena venus TaxID=2733690 RepID=A0A8H7D5Z0_9AGAR|nr:Glutathione S-transferase [Mycena venus]